MRPGSRGIGPIPCDRWRCPGVLRRPICPICPICSSVPDAATPSGVSHLRQPSRLRQSLAGRIAALVMVVVVATAASALVILGQLRTLQEGFDLLTEVYVEFNDKLAEAHVQAVRIGEQVRTRRNQIERAAPELIPPPEPTFMVNFVGALDARRSGIAEARAPIDDALANPDRFGGEEQLADLRELATSLEALEGLVALDDVVDPNDVLVDIHSQSRIEQIFESLASRSGAAIRDLRARVLAIREKTEQLTLALTIAVSILGALSDRKSVV